jgi:hypothetical protein
MSLNKYFCSSICLKFLEFSTPTIVISLLNRKNWNLEKNSRKERLQLCFLCFVRCQTLLKLVDDFWPQFRKFWVFIVHIDTGSPVPNIPSQSRGLADENKKKNFWRNGNDSKQAYSTSTSLLHSFEGYDAHYWWPDCNCEM